MKSGKSVRELVLLNAARSTIVSVLNQLRKSWQPAARLLIYHAGHGWADKAVDEAFWIPTDAASSAFATYISAHEIPMRIKLMQARHVLVVATSCSAGALSCQAPPDLSMSESREQYLHNIKTRESRALLSSGAHEPVWDGGGGGHSVFVHAFLGTLSKLGLTPFVTQEAFLFIKEAVAGKCPNYRNICISATQGTRGGILYTGQWPRRLGRRNIP
jgi:uncharacterized caspase-like protein